MSDYIRYDRIENTIITTKIRVASFKTNLALGFVWEFGGEGKEGLWREEKIEK